MTLNRSDQIIKVRQLIRAASLASVNVSKNNRLYYSSEYPGFWYYVLNSLKKTEDWFKKQQLQKFIQEEPQTTDNKFPKQSNTNIKYIKTQMNATLPDLTGLTDSTSLTNLYSCTI